MTLKPRIVLGLVVAAGLLVLALANTHLVYVAVKSQPDCVEHVKPGARTDGNPQFSAAKSAC